MKRLDPNSLARPRLCVQSLEPAYGDNYKPGFLGFTQTGSSMLSVGIAHFTRWSRLSDIHISHVLVVTGENECVEAVGGKGIVKSTLDRYFADPKTQIFFRKPRKCTQSLGQRIAETALSQAGTKYETLLTVAQMLEGTFLRRWIMHHRGRLQGRPPHLHRAPDPPSRGTRPNPAPLWFHCPLVRDASGQRLAKRSDGLSIRELRAAGIPSHDVPELARSMSPASGSL